jgi:hypothetical protein
MVAGGDEGEHAAFAKENEAQSQAGATFEVIATQSADA